MLVLLALFGCLFLEIHCLCSAGAKSKFSSIEDLKGQVLVVQSLLEGTLLIACRYRRLESVATEAARILWP